MSNWVQNSQTLTLKDIQEAIQQANSIISVLDKENKRMSSVLSKIKESTTPNKKVA